MTTRKKQLDAMLELCGEVRDDDGQDPRHWDAQRHRRIDRRDRKTRQLCHQVAVTVDLVLSGEFEDALLHNLRVLQVTPAPDSSQLLVTLEADLAPGTATVDVVLSRLSKVAGRLRCEVARAITRKRAPQLQFRVMESQDVDSCERGDH